MKIAGLILLYIGVGVAVVSVLGLLRLKTFYLRVKALALLGFPAAVFIHTASSLLVPFEQGGARGLITALFFLLSGPVLSHAILLAARMIGADQEDG